MNEAQLIGARKQLETEVRDQLVYLSKAPTVLLMSLVDELATDARDWSTRQTDLLLAEERLASEGTG